MAFRLNPRVQAAAAPPIAAVHAWVAGRTFPASRPLLDMAQAAPSYPPATALREHLARSVSRAETSSYTEIAGLPSLRRGHAADTARRYGGVVESDHVVVTAGCNQAFCSVMTALAGPGDEVILPLPYYFNHPMWLEMQGVNAVHVPFNEDGGGMPRLEDFEHALTARTRAIAIITPNNPTGAVYPAALLADLYELACRRGIALVVDETYRDFLADEGPAHDLFSRAHWEDNLVQLYSFSKAYSLPGYRVGAVICGATLRAELLKIQDCVAICAPRIGQQAALFGLTHLQSWCHDKRRLMHERLEALRRAFAEPGMHYELICSGAYFAYVRHPFADEPAVDVARRLADDHNILCLPGSMFGPSQEGYLRFAFANLEIEETATLVERLRASQRRTSAHPAKASS